MKIRDLILPILMLSGCQKPEEHQITIWSDGSAPPPLSFSSPQFKNVERTVLVLGEVVRYSQQNWGPAKVEGGSLHLVQTPGGAPVFGRLQHRVSPDDPPSLNLQTLETLHLNRQQFLQQLKARNPWLRASRVMSDVGLVVIFEGKRPRPTYSIDVLGPGADHVDRYFVSPEYEFLRRERVSSHMDMPAWVFPVENQAQIREVLLRNLLQAPVLKSRTHQVLSQAPQKASPEQAPLNYPLEDPRFDQVQSFYFVQKALEFMAKELDFSLPVAVEVETAMGYPKKTNAAFTYRNQIRLGTGDDVTYKGLARDPSVVIHEVGHILTESLAHLPTQGEGGSLNEAFADYFAASYLNNPRMGHASFLKGPQKRNLEDVTPFSARTGGLYHDSLIVSGTLWELRSKFGPTVMNKVALRTLTRLGPAQSLGEFPRALLEASREFLTSDQLQTVSQVLRQRQWPD